MNKFNICKVILGVSLLTSFSMGANAVPIDADTWYVFSTNSGGATGGCSPADPTSSCVIPTGAVATGTSPWTFSGASVFEVLDGFSLIDQFEVFDFGVSVGVTSAAGGGSCGSDIAACLVNSNASYGSFNLGGGDHSITIQNISSSTSGAHFFRMASVNVPEPAVTLLFALGLIGLGISRKKTSV